MSTDPMPSPILYAAALAALGFDVAAFIILYPRVRAAVRRILDRLSVEVNDEY